MQLTGEQINEFLSKAILESQIGKAVQEAVTRSVSELSKGYNNPFDSVIKNAVATMIAKEVETTYRPILEAGIKEKLAQHMTDEMVSKIISAAISKLSSSY